MPKSTPEPETRLHGLDLARFAAFAGMVFVNFHVVTGSGNGALWAQIFLSGLEGKAAATFVVLAGIGLGLGAGRDSSLKFTFVTLKRALFLLVIGLINTLIFPADILHYYALYFVFGLMFVRASSRIIVGFALFLPLVFVALLFTIEFDTGWDWQILEYTDFWSVRGFVRNLFYNGWHPLIPWLSFLLMGMLLARMKLSDIETQKKLMLSGGVALFVAYAASFSLSALDPELGELVSVAPVPPLPIYMLGGAGAGAFVIGFCLWLHDRPAGKWLGVFSATGRQALSLYILHIIVGMGVLEALGLLGGQSAETAIIAAGLFILISLIYANLWARWFERGPFEWLMRQLAG